MLEFQVDAPRFTLNPSDIHSVYPPSDQTGKFDNTLPQVVFTRRTLPWERTLDGQAPNTEHPCPWLGLPLVEEDELLEEASSALDAWTLDAEGIGFKPKREAMPFAQQVQFLSGATLLTPGAPEHLASRLRQYKLAHGNEPLEKLASVVNALNLLGQNLGGFAGQLLMRKSLLELKSLEPDGEGDPKYPPIFDAVRDIDWLSPLTDSQFFPVRAGEIELTKLWIIDAFGRLLKLADKSLSNPCPPGSLRGPQNQILLQPRLAQPTRLNMDWSKESPALCG